MSGKGQEGSLPGGGKAKVWSTKACWLCSVDGHGVDSDPQVPQVSPLNLARILPDISGDMPVLEIGSLSECYK